MRKFFVNILYFMLGLFRLMWYNVIGGNDNVFV